MSGVKLTSRLLKRAGRLAEAHHAVLMQIDALFRERYGVVYSEIDADEIIDVLDYTGGELTLADCDRIMSELGYPPDPSPSHGEAE